MAKPKKVYHRVNFALGFIALLILTLALLNWGHLLKSDEGVVLNGAWNLYHGRQIYHDFFEYISPGSFYLVWLIMKIFSPSYLAIQLVSLALMALVISLLFRIYLSLSPNKYLAAFASFFWLIVASVSCPLINHNVYSTFLTIVVVYLLIVFLEKQRAWQIFLSGVGTALIFYFLQTKGILIFLALLLFILILLRQKRVAHRYLLFFLAGIAIISIGGLSLWGEDPYTAPFLVATSYHQINQVPFLYLILFLLTIPLAYLLIKKEGQHKNQLILLIIVQTALCLSTINRPDLPHLVLNSFPIIIIFTLGIERKMGRFWQNGLIRFFVLGCLTIIYLSLI